MKKLQPNLLKAKNSHTTMMMMMMKALLIPSLLLGLSQAEKDDSYYIAGTGNPNVYSKMYWKDSENVLQDLSQFSALYVQYHSCSWTWMQQDDAGNDVDENNYWYLGKIPPMGANVAFSLYGTLKSGGSSSSGCNKNTFINSFYTNQGFTSFATAMKSAGVSGFSSYSSSSSSSSYTSECQGGYGVGCDASNGFAVHKYKTNECNPQYVSGVKDKLTNLNSAMENVQCTKIYDSNSYSSSNYYNDDGSYSSSGKALDLLYYSHACFYQDYFYPDGECPDPYGILAGYQEKFHEGIVESRSQQPYQVYQRRHDYGEKIEKEKITSFVGVGLFAVAAAIFLLDEICRPKRKRAVVAKKRGDGIFHDEADVQHTGGDGIFKALDDVEQGGAPVQDPYDDEANGAPAGYTGMNDEPENTTPQPVQEPFQQEGLMPPASDMEILASRSYGSVVADEEAMAARFKGITDPTAPVQTEDAFKPDGLAPLADDLVAATKVMTKL